MDRDVWLTVVTVVRNDAGGLRVTGDSVARQDRAGVEHLIVDGASSDDTRGVLREMEADSRIVSEPDAGIYDAMNKGWRLARGRYVQYLNAGDVYATPEELAWVRQQVGSAGPAWLRTRVRFVDAAGNPTRPVGSSAIDDHFWWGWQTTLHQGAFMTRDLLQGLGGFDPHMRVQGDFDLMLRALQAGVIPLRRDRVTGAVDASGVSPRLWRVGYGEMHRARTREVSAARRLASRIDLGAHLGVVTARRGARRSLEAVLGADRVTRLRG